MRIGCFALVEPFSPMQRQFEAIAEMGIAYADLTDNFDGGMLGVEYGFTSAISLDSHPATIRDMAAACGLTLTSICAHANLLDPPSPSIYSTNQIIKAIRLAKLLGIKHVITTEGDPKTDFGRGLTTEQQLFAICERLQSPMEWAQELGVELLIETHGQVTDNVATLGELLSRLGHEETVGLCLDTGNSWLGGADPLDHVKAFSSRIKHVHWKDLGTQWQAQRGKHFGCGMGDIALGDGVIGVKPIAKALRDAGFDGATTLEIAGAENVAKSVEKLNEWTSD